MNILPVSARNIRRVVLKTIVATVALLPVAPSLDSALAQDYPTKSITAVVPFAAGGGSDTQTRIWGEAWRLLSGTGSLSRTFRGRRE